MGRLTKIISIVSILFLSLWTNQAYAESRPQLMPPHPNLLSRLRAQGYDSVTVLNLRRLGERKRALGIDQPKLITAPVTGNKPALVLLVEFSDMTHNATSTPTFYSNLLFSVGTYPAPGSMRDFYREVSYGTFDINPGGVDSAWRQTSQPHTYYANNDGTSGTLDDYGWGDYPNNAQKLVEDAVNLANPYVNFSSYATGGAVQGLFIVHAGRGAETDSTHADWIWSHKWALNEHAMTVDGVLVNDYSMEPEYVWSAGDSTVGIFCHEYGHVLGLPDLYDYDGSSYGLGAWSLMAGGSWNGVDGNSPAHPDAWSRAQFGWVTPQVVTDAITAASIPSAETNATSYRLWTNGALGTEYFLVENRQKTGFDSALPGAGLLLFHVDENAWQENDWHPLVMLEQADGWWDLQTLYNNGDDGDPYPGSSNNRTANATSIPDTRDYSGLDTGVIISNISNSGATMTADLAVHSDIIPAGGLFYPIAYETVTQSQAAIGGKRISWSDAADAVYGIRCYDLLNGQYTWAAQGSPTQVLSAASGDFVLWMDDRSGHWNFHTMLYDIAHGVEFQVSEHATNNMDPSYLWAPAIDGNLVAYTDPVSNTNFDLYLYDLSVDSDSDGVPNYRDPDRPSPDPARRALVTGTSNIYDPRISGRRIVYVDNRNGNNDVFIYDLDLDREFPLCTDYNNQNKPDISGNYVVWVDMRSGNGDIYLYDLTVDSDGDGTPNWQETTPPDPDPALQNLTPDPAAQTNPSISGDLVVWEDPRYGGADGTDILIYDLSTHTQADITHDSYDQAAPRISNGIVVFQELYSGVDWDIWAWGSPRYYGALGITVLDAVTYNLIPGATVTCAAVSRLSDVDGIAYLPFVPIGPSQLLAASAPGYHPLSYTFPVTAGESWFPIGLIPLGYGLINGWVTDADTGLPINNALVVSDSWSSPIFFDGYYGIIRPAGTGISVTASAPGYQDSTTTGVTLPDGGYVEVNFALHPIPPGAIGGTVKDAATGLGILGATVTVGTQSTTSGADGAYLISNVPIGSGYSVSATAVGYLDSTVSGVAVSPGQTTTVNFSLTPLVGSIAGTVRDSVTTLPITGATVTCGSLSDTTDSRGRYRFDSVRVGSNYTVSASATGYTAAQTTNVSVSVGQTTTVDFALSAAAFGTITGTVTNASTGYAVTGVRINCGALSTLNGAGGVYTLPGIPVGTYNVGAAAAGYQWASVSGVVVTAGGTTTVNIALTRLPTTTGKQFQEIQTGFFPSAAGSAWGDYDGDGYADLFLGDCDAGTGVPVPHGPLLYHNNRDLTFTDVSQSVGLTDVAYPQWGVAWGDYDNNGLPDILVGDAYWPFLYRQNQTGFVDVAGDAGFHIAHSSSYSQTWCDYNGDNFLDAFCANIFGPGYLMKNNGNGTFTEMSATAGMTGEALNDSAHGACWGDYNNDGWPDLALARLAKPSKLYRNNGDGTFTDVSAQSGVSVAIDALSAIWGDYDNDGWLDLYITTSVYIPGEQQRDWLFHNNHDETFTEVSASSGMTVDNRVGAGAAWVDYNNDGFLDLYVSSWGANPLLYHNWGNGTFVNEVIGSGLEATFSYQSGAAAWADIDLDGREDLFQSTFATSINDNRSRLFHNIGSTGNWLRVRALTSGTGDATATDTPTRDAIGARVELNVDNDFNFLPGRTLTRMIDGGSSWLGQNEQVAHFGVPTNGPVAVRVKFPDGSVVTHYDVAVNQTIVIRDVPADRIEETFDDVPLDSWAYTAIQAIVDAGIARGYDSGNYEPTWPVARDQMAVFISRALAGGDANVPDGPATASFTDVPAPPNAHWAYKYIEYAKAHNIVSGYPEGDYKPSLTLDRGQMAVFIARAIAPESERPSLPGYTPPTSPSFPDVTAENDWSWAYKFVEYIADPARAITQGYEDGNYHPERTCTRDQMAVYIARAFQLPM